MYEYWTSYEGSDSSGAEYVCLALSLIHPLPGTNMTDEQPNSCWDYKTITSIPATAPGTDFPVSFSREMFSLHYLFGFDGKNRAVANYNINP